MAEKTTQAPGGNRDTMIWLGSCDADIRRGAVRLPPHWRPKAPLAVVSLIWISGDDMRAVWIAPGDQGDALQAQEDGDGERILFREEWTLQPDGLIRLPDAFLSGFADPSDAQVVLTGMYGHIEIYRREDRERLEQDAMALLSDLDRLLQDGQTE